MNITFRLYDYISLSENKQKTPYYIKSILIDKVQFTAAVTAAAAATATATILDKFQTIYQMYIHP
jgi:hypothetical protein